MGGDSHGHHHAPKWIPPDWREYKVAGVPRAEEHVRKLAALGLKDPWIRNEVWRYHPEFYKPSGRWMGWLLLRGAPYGVGAFLLYFAYDRMIGSKSRQAAHGDGHGHGHEQPEQH